MENHQNPSKKPTQSAFLANYGHDVGFGSKIKESVVPFIPPIKTRKRWYGFAIKAR
jgi:hypothetical protein